MNKREPALLLVICLIAFQFALLGMGLPSYAKDTVKLPKLMVTEIVPNSTDAIGTDGIAIDAYEFIEIYNQTNESIHLKGFKIIYNNGVTNTEWPIIEDKMVPAKDGFRRMG